MANQGSTPGLWLTWSGMLATLAAVAAVPALAGPEDPWWADARIEVFTYPITLFSVTCGVGSLALREGLLRAVLSGKLDPHSAEGGGRVKSVLLRAWALCVAVAILGAFIAWVAADPRRVWPYAVGAAALLVFHAPRSVVPRPS